MGQQQRVNVREWLDQCAPDEVRDALDGMLLTVDRVAYALTQDGRTSDGISKESAANRLRAALATLSREGR